jgi:hypothetical protein
MPNDVLFLVWRTKLKDKKERKVALHQYILHYRTYLLVIDGIWNSWIRFTLSTA